MKTFEFCARNEKDVMKLFKTEEEAYEYAKPDSSIAKYASENGTDFNFVKIVGLKTSADNIAKILQQ